MAATASERIAKPPSLSDLARAELQRAEGDTEKATTNLVVRLHRDRELLRLVIEDAISIAVSSCVEGTMRGKRAALIRTSTEPRSSEEGQAAATAHVHFLTTSLLDFPLANGLKLREATREQVEIQANRYELFANDTARKARWLFIVAQFTPAGKRVGDVISDERALELWRNAAPPAE